MVSRLGTIMVQWKGHMKKTRVRGSKAHVSALSLACHCHVPIDFFLVILKCIEYLNIIPRYHNLKIPITDDTAPMRIFCETRRKKVIFCLLFYLWVSLIETFLMSPRSAQVKHLTGPSVSTVTHRHGKLPPICLSVFSLCSCSGYFVLM